MNIFFINCVFDQVSFRSTVVLIKCRSINCRSTGYNIQIIDAYSTLVATLFKVTVTEKNIAQMKIQKRK